MLIFISVSLNPLKRVTENWQVHRLWVVWLPASGRQRENELVRLLASYQTNAENRFCNGHVWLLVCARGTCLQLLIRAPPRRRGSRPGQAVRFLQGRRLSLPTPPSLHPVETERVRFGWVLLFIYRLEIVIFIRFCFFLLVLLRNSLLISCPAYDCVWKWFAQFGEEYMAILAVLISIQIGWYGQ